MDRCIRCGIGSRLVFQGSGKFLCTSCMDVSKENETNNYSNIGGESIENAELKEYKVQSLISGLWN